MTTTSKITLSVLAASILSLGSVSATPINGSISFAGNVTAYVGNTGSGTVAANYGTAGSLAFGNAYVTSPNPTGSFSALPVNVNGSVTVYTPLLINPVQLPAGNQFLWSVGSFSFTATSLTETLLPGGTVLILQGTGVMSDNSNTYTDNTGSWTATFTTASSGGQATFGWNSSGAADINVPETGTSVLMLGLGLAALGAYGQFRKQVA